METPDALVSGEATAGAGHDRLSELPDCLLEDVLSRITSRKAARTSVLSRRWRHLWQAVPCVDIDQSEFWTFETVAAAIAELEADIADEERSKRLQKQWDAFEDLADILLPPVHGAPPPTMTPDTFRLRVGAENFIGAQRYIRRGLQRRPVAFHLCCDNNIHPAYSAYYDETWPLFPSHTLHLHAGAFLCRVRTLHLSGLRLTRGFADDVATASPLLETLHIDDCRCDFVRLASVSLKELSMDHCMRIEKLVLAAPCITSLRIHDHKHKGVSAPISFEGDLPSLVTASLACPDGAYGFLSSLRHTRSLSLSRFCVKALLPPRRLNLSWLLNDMALHDEEEPEDTFPMFHDLRILLLDECDLGLECEVLQRFLRASPKLETLTLRNCKFSGSPWSKKRKARSEINTSSSGWTRYNCKDLKSIELEFEDDSDVKVLADALTGFSKPRVLPIQTSAHDGKRKVNIFFI